MAWEWGKEAWKMASVSSRATQMVRCQMMGRRGQGGGGEGVLLVG